MPAPAVTLGRHEWTEFQDSRRDGRARRGVAPEVHRGSSRRVARLAQDRGEPGGARVPRVRREAAQEAPAQAGERRGARSLGYVDGDLATGGETYRVDTCEPRLRA